MEADMELAGKKVFILTETMYNDLEFWYPYYRLKEAGAEVIVVGPMGGMVYTGKAGLPVKADAGLCRYPPRPNRYSFFCHQG